MTNDETNETDRRLLALLRVNARMSTSELARRLDLSRSTVLGRVKRLEQRGIITGYTTVYGRNYAQRLLAAHVLIKVAQKLTERTYRELQHIPEVTALYAISGDFDMIAIVRTESTAELSRLLDQISHLSGVERTQSSVILEEKFER